MTDTPYGEDLAWVHDSGFGNAAREAADFVIALLRSQGLPAGLVVDLGCGSGLFLEKLATAGYAGHGVDLSPDMIRLARERLPSATFATASVYAAALPPCICVAATGEVINYAFAGGGSDDDLRTLFARVRDALPSGGYFVFDIATPGRAPESGRQQKFGEGMDWTVLVQAESPPERDRITRTIITFRDVEGDGRYRRSIEVHEQRLFEPEWGMQLLREAGFDVTMREAYGEFRLPGWAVLVGRKT